MKKHTHRPTLLALLAACLVLAGCHSEEARMRQAAQGYLDAMGNYRIADAAPYATQATRQITLPAMLHFMQRADFDSTYMRSNTPATITLGALQRHTDSTATILYHKSTPLSETDDSLRLHLEGGQWLAHAVLNPMARQLMYSDTMQPISRENLQRMISQPIVRTQPPAQH